MSEPLVIIGKGMAATRLIDELSKRALGRYAIAVIGDEPRRAYNRVLLSPFLAGEIEEGDMELKPASWWAARGVTTLYGQAAVEIDAQAKRVMLANGASIPYSKLALATGSQPIRLPIPGADFPNVVTFRDFNDVAAMLASAGRGKRAVVIGGGLLGLEAAYGLARHGAAVTVVHLMDRLMERQLDPEAAELLASGLRAKGIEVALNAQTQAIEGDARARRVLLKDGRSFDADLVVLAAGIRPNVALARAAGVAINRGIVVDDRLTSSDPDIFALGECAEHRGAVYGLVEPAYEQARTLAGALAGEDVRYEGSVTATNLKVTGVNVFSAGEFLESEGAEIITLRDRGARLYKKLVIRDDRLIGVVLVGHTSDGLWYLDLIREAASIDAIRDALIFGRSVADRLAA
ncbi:NAD(P)/FAD-dependent oxidoreductase [Terrarubrum flagellatum]|uniref:NAD(P)/FAD-dependent oxidoreductase n=1 Tax=Terrirubrum flagellatum TaxID=2895980 RepID=UPI003144E459